MRRGPGFLWLQVPGWLLFVYLVYAQAIPAFDYELGVRMGTQEPGENITAVGVAFWAGFAFADLVVYIPLLGIGLIGHGFQRPWWKPVLGAAIGITIYWPVVVLAAAVGARDAPGWEVAEASYWMVLAPLVVWAFTALIVVARYPNRKLSSMR